MPVRTMMATVSDRYARLVLRNAVGSKSRLKPWQVGEANLPAVDVQAAELGAAAVLAAGCRRRDNDPEAARQWALSGGGPVARSRPIR
jgi:hypothetical protein